MPTFSSRNEVISPFQLEELRATAASSETLRGLVDRWQSKRRDGRLPAREDFSLVELRPWLGWISLVDVTHDPLTLRWRLVGTEIADRLGRDVTGRPFEEVYDEQWLPRVLATFTKAVERREPVYFRGTLEFVDKDHVHFSVVHLPLARDGVTVDMLMAVADFG